MHGFDPSHFTSKAQVTRIPYIPEREPGSDEFRARTYSSSSDDSGTSVDPPEEVGLSESFPSIVFFVPFWVDYLFFY